jgi:hypothetical protein
LRDNSNTSRTRRDPVRQANGPTALALVDLHYDAAVGRRKLTRGINEKETGTELRYWNGASIHKQVDPYIGGVAAIAARLEFDE